MNKLFFISSIFFCISCNSEKGNSVEETPSADSSRVASTYASPPAISPKNYDYDTTEWSELINLDSSIIMDLRYATTNNFVLEKMYDCPRCFLRPVVAEAMVEANRLLKKRKLRIKMFDCYRPRPIQQKLWKKIPDPRYVANPEKGSMHNRGVAVDVTIVKENGEELEMGTPFDYFGKKAYQYYKNLPDSVLTNRRLLRKTMHKVGLNTIKTEWWHFSYQIKEFPISDFLWNCPE